MRTPHKLSLSIVSAATLPVLTLTGCTANTPETGTVDEITASPAGTVAPAPSETTTVPLPSASATSMPADLGSCETLLPDAAATQFHAGLVPDSGYAPASGSYAAEIVSFGGIACGWTDSATGASLTVAVAQPPTDDLTTAETAFGGGAGTQTGVFGSDLRAYTADGGGTFTGDIEVFTPDGYWLSTVSSLYTSPESAKPIVSEVLQALPSS